MPNSPTSILATAALAGTVLAAACASASRSSAAPIDPRVLDTVRSQDSVAVLVILATPDSAPDSPERRTELRRLQASVLDALEPGTYRVGRRFDTLPALALTLYGEAAVHALARQELVERIGLDDGGGGGRP